MLKSTDGSIPIEFISKISKREANSRKPVYQIHKWFGRKTDAIFRSFLLALALDKNKTNEFENIYYSDNPDILKGKIILDPFMGGGVTLVNTLRLGAKAIGVDINPVAWFITKNELQVPEVKEDNCEEEIIKKLNDEFERIEKSIGNEIKEAYTTEIYDDDEKTYRKVDVMYVLWIKRARCPSCGRYARLFPSYSITRLNNKSFENYNICPKCGRIVRGNEKNLTCVVCKHEFDREMGVYRGRNFTCDNCGGKWNVMRDIMKKRKSPLSADIYAIQYYDPKTKKKDFKIPDKKDLDRYKEIKEKFQSLNIQIDKFIPKVEIPNGYNTKQVKNHSYNYWNQMFNYRQLYYLGRLMEEIDKIEDEKIKELFLCVFSNTINANNMFCIYNSQCGKIEPLFGDHHMAPVLNPVENNLWGTKLGRGTFVKYFKALIHSKEFNCCPYERKNLDGKNNNIMLKSEKFYAKFADDFQDLICSDKNAMIKCGSADELSFIPNDTIDAVITDPPYYSAINYGEISEFFYVWEREILKNKYSFFHQEHIPFNDEVTVNEARGITKQQFQNKLTYCFQEIKRVLKKDGPLILTYNNSTADGWLVLMEALINSGFLVEKTYPIHTELRAGLIDNKREKMNYDLIIIAKAKENINENSISFKEFMDKTEIEFNNTYLQLNDKKLALLDENLIKVGKAFELYSKYGNNIYMGSKKINIEYILNQIYHRAKQDILSS